MKIKKEVVKQYRAGFLEVVDYLVWLVNLAPVPKKDVKLRMWIAYRDLNKARHVVFSFIDTFSSYNQFKMMIEDREKTS